MRNLRVLKREGEVEPFEAGKIAKAILKAMRLGSGRVKQKIAEDIATEILDFYINCDECPEVIPIKDIDNMVYDKLLSKKQRLTAKSYTEFRGIREFQKETENTIDEQLKSMLGGTDEYWATENSNKNPRLVTTHRDYMAGIVSTDATRRYKLPPEIVQAHDNGILHFHDADYFLQKMYNCCLVNLDDQLQNGTVISGTLIEKPHKFSTACNIGTQIIAQIASSQYGGQTISLYHLSKFVNESRKTFRERLIADNLGLDDATLDKLVNKMVLDDITAGVQTLQYQVITLQTTNGQAPFLSVFMYLNEAQNESEKEDLALVIEEVLKQRIQGVKNQQGIYITPAFPKLLYALEEDNIHEGDKYWYLTELAAKCTAKRLVPDYISEKKMLEYKVDANGDGHCYPCMGCRSFLTTYLDGENRAKYYGRFNQGVVTLNLVDVALSSEKDEDRFWSLLDERCELCHEALKLRHIHLENTVSDVAPILWQDGAIARLKPGETINNLLHGGYSTISLGYCGLYETVKYMTGKSHSDEADGEEFGLKVMEFLNNKCKQWKYSENIDYSLYGTPLESTTYKFAKTLKERFGVIEGITDKNYVTNSYHIPVFEEIDPFEKLRIESKFQKLSPGGAISYIETANLNTNIPAVLEVIKYIYDNIMYAELNTKSDYCHECGYDGEIELIDSDGQLIWKCPNCGNTDPKKMNVARRTCGYIGTATNGWNQGRLGDIHDRFVHLSDISCC